MSHPHAPNHLGLLAQAQDTPAWKAAWIWFAGESWTVNFYGLARKTFALSQPVQRATIYISAYSDYLLRIDGHYVGRGPMPCDPWYQSFDSYDVTAILQGPGGDPQGDRSTREHILAVICHNTGVGTHRQHRGRGGLIVQLEIETENGLVTVTTDDSWQLSRESGWAGNAPRQFWSTEFMEIFDARQQPEGWEQAGFDDTAWEAPHVYGTHPTHPWHHLLPRPIPLLRETPLNVTSIEKGEFKLQDIHAVRFDNQAGIYYAQTAFYSDKPRKLTLHIECDDAFKLFFNGQLEVTQSYDEYFSRTRMWRNKDEYEQVHYGIGSVGFTKELSLQKGWNSLTVVVDQGPAGWGFMLALLNSTSRKQVQLACAAEGQSDRWSIAGPFESSGLNDSLAEVVSGISQLTTTSRLSPAFDYAGGVTDCATLMRYEQRDAPTTQSVTEALTLTEGEYCIIDIGRVEVTHPALLLRTDKDGSTLDIGYNQLAYEDHSIHFSNGERMKYVDRVVLSANRELSWEPFLRRTGRYIHISCRAGSVTLAGINIRATGYPVERKADFCCSDEMLNRIWDVSTHTTALLMHHGYQDCLKREQDTFNTSSFNYTSRSAALCFGDTALSAKTLRLGAQLQNESGWFDSHGLSGLNSDEPTECLWWVIWLRDHYQISGDRALVEELFEPVEDVLRFFAKMSDQHGLLDVKNWHIFRPGQSIYIDDAVTYGAPPTIEFYNGYSEGATSGLNMLYYAALSAAAALARELDETERAAFYQRKADRVTKALNKRLWNTESLRYADWRTRDEAGGELSASAHPVMQITATYFGISDEKRTEQILHMLNDEMGLPDETRPDYPLYTFGYYFYWLESLFRHGQAEQALALMRRYYGRWLTAIPGGATTFGEYFRLSEVPDGKLLRDEYEVHAYGASAHLHFYTNILGVRPAAPGFRKVLIAPQPGDLSWARGKVQTPQGPVEVAWEKKDGELQLDVEVPEGVTYEVQWPEGVGRGRVKVNGESGM